MTQGNGGWRSSTVYTTKRKSKMKQRKATTIQITATPQPLLDRPDLGTAVTKRTEEQLVDEPPMAVCESTGTHSYDVADRLVCQVASAQVWPRSTDEADRLLKATALIGEMAPQNAMEAIAWRHQMIATNDAALMFLHRATSEGQTTEVVDVNVLRSTRLMRLFNQQVETMQKLKGKSTPAKSHCGTGQRSSGRTGDCGIRSRTKVEGD